MSYQITTAQIQQYSTNIGMLLQQMGTRLRGAVNNYALQGKAATVLEQFGAASPVFGLARHADTPVLDVPQDRRWAYPTDVEFGALIDSQDKLRLLIDPTGPYTQAAVNALGRGIDDIILSAFFNANNTGENGSTSTSTLYAYNSNSQSVAAATGAGSATGLNIAKLRLAKRKLLEADLDIDNDTLYCVISAKQHDDLLNEAQAVSLDYNTRPVLVDGKITSFMGFNFIHSERIPGAANWNSALNPAITSADSDGSYVAASRWLVPVFAKSGMGLGIWGDIETQVAPRADKRFATQVYSKMTVGATRLEEKRCVLINCK